MVTVKLFFTFFIPRAQDIIKNLNTLVYIINFTDEDNF